MSNNARKKDMRDLEVITLLNQLGDRMIRSERDRVAMKGALDRYDELFATFEEWQKVQEARIEKAESFTLRLEEALSQQARLSRRLEKITQDKVRMLRKLERIEETVLETREALNSKALVLLTDRERAVAALDEPLLPSDPRRNAAGAERDKAAAWWDNRPLFYKVAGITAVAALALCSAWAVSHLPAKLAQPAAETTAGTIVFDNTSATAAEPVPQPSSSIEPMTISDQEKIELMDTNPDKLAAALNAIEPGETAQTESTPVENAESMETQTVAITQTVEEPVDVAPAADAEETIVAEAPTASKAEPATQAKPVAAMPTPPDMGDISSEAFINEQKNTRPLSEVIQPDPSLPAVVREIEARAFEGLAEAQHDLGAIYTAGHGGVTVNYTRAAAWFREAAVKGIANARYNLGVLYHQGLGVPKNVDVAIGWYRAAAELGHPEAQYNLGIAHIEGIGTEYDPKKAAWFFEQSARSGIMEAAYNLGLIYENGLLGAPDAKNALFWYKNAADQGSPEARTAMEQLSRQMKIDPGSLGSLFADDSVKPATPSTKTQSAPVESKAEKKEKTSALPTKEEAIPRLALSDTSTARNEQDQAITAQIQEQLIRLGLYPGPADGILGPQTEDAIRTYEGMNSLERAGKPSEALLVHMLTRELDSTITPGSLTDTDILPPGEFGSAE